MAVQYPLPHLAFNFPLLVQELSVASGWGLPDCQSICYSDCHETTARAARLEQGVLVTLRWIGFSELRGERGSQLGAVSTVATLPQVKGPRGSVHDEA